MTLCVLQPFTRFERAAWPRYALGKLSAKDVCNIAWLCRHHQDLNVSDLAMDLLDGSGGNAARHINQQLGTTSVQNTWCQVTLPMWHKGQRVLKQHPVFLPHERATPDDLPVSSDAAVYSLPVFRQLPLARNPDGTVVALGPQSALVGKPLGAGGRTSCGTLQLRCKSWGGGRLWWRTYIWMGCSTKGVNVQVLDPHAPCELDFVWGGPACWYGYSFARCTQAPTRTVASSSAGLPFTLPA